MALPQNSCSIWTSQRPKGARAARHGFGNRAEDRRRRGRAYRDGFDAGQREPRRKATACRAGAGAIGVASRASRHASPASKPGWKPSRRRRGRGGAQAVRRTDRQRTARRDHRAGGECFSHLVATPHLVFASTIRSTSPPRADRTAGEAKRLRGAPGDPGGAGSRQCDCRIEWRTAASCWSARRSKPRSTNSSGAMWRPAIKPRPEAMRTRHE